MSASSNRADMIRDAKFLAKMCGDKDKFKRFNVKASAIGCPLSLYLEMSEYVGNRKRLMEGK